MKGNDEFYQLPNGLSSLPEHLAYGRSKSESFREYMSRACIYHGMVEVRKTVNLSKHLEKTGTKESEDYVVFLDSPLARF